MFSIFKTKDEKLFQALIQDGIEITIQEIQKASENDAETLYKIGLEYYKKYKYEKAFTWFHKAALQNHAEAQAQVGYMYQCGQRVPRDYQQAMDWNMKAASAGNANGQYNIGDLYHSGRGVSQDDKQAMDWWLKAANNGNTEAMRSIGLMYRFGESTTKNIRTAIEWYTKAANQGNAMAQFNLGNIYQTDDEVKDLQKAVNWYQKATDNNHDFARGCAKILNKEGYYAKDDAQEGEKATEEGDAVTNIVNDQSQFSITASNNDEHFNKLMKSKIDNLENMFQSKMALTERDNNDALPNKPAALRQKELQQDEENKQLRDELAKSKVATEDNINNDLNYDSSDNDADDNTDTTDVSIMQGSNDALQKELADLKQRELDHQKENQRLKERLARMEEAMQNNADNDLNYDSSDNESNGGSATNNVDVKKKDDYALQKERVVLKQKELEQREENQLLRERLARIVAVQDDPHNDSYYNSSDNEDDDKNDITYNTKLSNGEKKEDRNNVTNNTQQRESHYHSVEIYADPNYDSSDNEDPRNDKYLN